MLGKFVLHFFFNNSLGVDSIIFRRAIPWILISLGIVSRVVKFISNILRKKI